MRSRHSYTTAAAAFLACIGLLGATGCGGSSDCNGVDGAAASRDVLVTISKPEDPSTVIAQARPDASGHFTIDGLSDGLYILRTLRTDPDTEGQQPFYQGLYIDSETTVRIPDVCTSGAAINTQ